MDLTVAICTYRRHEPLRETLQSLADCDPVGLAWELLVVDNGDDREIQRLVESYAEKLPVRYVAEPTLGTSYARNRAVRDANGPIVLFTDDDVTFDPHWLARMAKAIQDQPDCAFWGGRVEPVWPRPAPKWFDIQRSAILGDCVVRYQRGDQPRLWDPEHDPPFYTANLALRVDRVAHAGYFDTGVGHRGNTRMGMEDSLMVRAIASAGGRGWYAADAIVHHPVPPERMSRRFARGFAWRQGWLSTQLHRAEAGGVPRWLYRVAATGMARGLGQWCVGWFRLDAAQRFAGELAALFNFSKIWHALTARPSKPRSDAPSKGES